MRIDYITYTQSYVNTMSKKTLNLSIREEIKERAKKLARQKGMSVSRLFEELVADQEDPDEYTPTPGSAAYELTQLIPDSEREIAPDYDKLKEEALKDKYGED